MASAVRIRPSTSPPAADEIPLAASSPGSNYVAAVWPSQAWELNQPLGTTGVGIPFTVLLATTDVTSSWLSEFINTTELKLTGSIQEGNTLQVLSLDCNLIHPAPSNGIAVLSLDFSTMKDAVQQQFGSWDGPQTGLDVFDHEAGLLFGVQNANTAQPVPFGSVIELSGIHISAWAMTLLDAIHLRLRTTEPATSTTSSSTSPTPARNGLWVFPIQRRTVLRLEFELDTDGLPKDLIKFLPAHSLQDLVLSFRKTAHFSLLREKPEIEGELFLASQIVFEVDKDLKSSFQDVKLGLYILLSLNGTTFKIHNECKVSFEDMVLIMGEHLEMELQAVGLKTGLDEVKNRLKTHLTHEGNSNFDIHWREFAMTISGDTLVGVSLLLEVDTPFGVDEGKQSAFLFSFEWSPRSNDIKLSGKFWPVPAPEHRSTEKMPIDRRLNPIDEGHSIIQPMSSNAQSVLNLTKLYPGFSPGKLPHWIPDEITLLEVALSTTDIDFAINLSSQSSPNDSPGLPFDEDTMFSISFHYTLGQPNSAVLSLKAGISLHAPESFVDIDPCLLSVGVDYENPKWTVSASAKNVRSANLHSLLPQSVRDDIISMMPNVYVPGLFVDYVWGGPDPSQLSVSGYLVIGGLLLSVYFQHTSDGSWGLVAKLNAEPSKAAGEKTTIKDLIEDMMGDDAGSLLPAYVNNVEVPLDDLEDDGITLHIMKSEAGPIFLFSVRLDSVHFDFVQIPGDDKNQPKRLLRLSLHAFPDVPDIPLVGKVPQPFDQVSFVWSKFDFSWDELKLINTTLFDDEEDSLQVKPTQDEKQNPIAFKKGLHFMVSMNQDGKSTVVIDYVFGQSPQKNLEPSAVTEKGVEFGEESTHAVATTSSSTQVNDAEPEVGPQSEMAPIKKSQNSLSITNVGLQMTGHVLTIHLNATVKLGPIEMALTGFALHLDLTNAKLPHLDNITPTFSLDGLAVSYDRSPVHITGLFLHQKTANANTFAGGVVIGLSKYTFAAVGVYSEVTPNPPQKPFKSFFVFGALTGPLMHFEFGEVRGISGGFGYNSFVTLPDVSAVSQFPFLSMMNSDTSDPSTTLQLFTSGDTIKSQTDALWLAAGLKLRIFEVIDVSAVVSLQLSQGDPVLAIVADATAMVPQSAKSVEDAFALIDFGVIATLDLGHGTLIVQGQINPQSFVLSHACHPTGGFALCVWSEDSGHGGDLVFSVGGFHPAFARPSHYPNPPRVGISWIFDSHISITGGAYYAITPAAIMAGGTLQALFSMGSLSAHFDAHADFLVNFEPFHYQASVGIMAGVSYELKVWFITKKFSIELAADLDIHGPPMAGVAHFSFWVMSFDVSFGSSQPKVAPLTLQAFWDMLSKGTPGDSSHIMTVESGLIPSLTEKDDSSQKKATISLVRGGSLQIGVYSRIPINLATYAGTHDLKNDTAIYNRPMQLTDTKMDSSIDFIIEPLPESAFSLKPIIKDVPASIWGNYNVSDKALLAGNTPQTISHTMGVRLIAPEAIRSDDKLPKLDSEFFGKSCEIDGHLGLSEKPYVYSHLKLDKTVPTEPVTTLAATDSATIPPISADSYNNDSGQTPQTHETTAAEKVKDSSFTTEKPEKATPPDDAFTSAKNVWKETTQRSVDLGKILRVFALEVADQLAFGAAHAPGMQPNAGWAELEALAKPPMQYIDHMEEYYLQPPQVLV